MIELVLSCVFGGIISGFACAHFFYSKRSAFIRDLAEAQMKDQASTRRQLLQMVEKLENKLAAKDITTYAALQDIDRPTRSSSISMTDEREALIAGRH